MGKVLDLEDAKKSENAIRIANASGPAAYLYSLVAKMHDNKFWRDISNRCLNKPLDLQENTPPNPSETIENTPTPSKDSLKEDKPPENQSNVNQKIEETENSLKDSNSSAKQEQKTIDKESKGIKDTKSKGHSKYPLGTDLDNSDIESESSEESPSSDDDDHYRKPSIIPSDESMDEDDEEDDISESSEDSEDNEENEVPESSEDLEDNEENEVPESSEDLEDEDDKENEVPESSENSEDENNKNAYDVHSDENNNSESYASKDTKKTEETTSTENNNDSLEETGEKKEEENPQTFQGLANTAETRLEKGLASEKAIATLKDNILPNLLKLYPEFKELKELMKNIKYLEGSFASKLKDNNSENAQTSEQRKFLLLDRFEFLDTLEEYIKNTIAKIYYSPENKRDENSTELSPANGTIAVLAQLLRKQGTKDEENSYAFEYEEIKKMVEERNKIEDAKSNNGRGSKELDPETINIGLIRTFAIFLFTAKKNNWIKKEDSQNESNGSNLPPTDWNSEKYSDNFAILQSKGLDIKRSDLYFTIETDWKTFKKTLPTDDKKKEIKELTILFKEIIETAKSYYNGKLPSKIKNFIEELKSKVKPNNLDEYTAEEIVNLILYDKTAFDNTKATSKLIGKE